MARRRRDEVVDSVDLESFNEWHRLLMTRSVPSDEVPLLKVADAPAEWQERLVVSLLSVMARRTPQDHWCHAVLESGVLRPAAPISRSAR